jgi:hypothetical protein
MVHYGARARRVGGEAAPGSGVFQRLIDPNPRF